MATATTISTVAVKVGRARIILAILRSGQSVVVRLQQMEPDLVYVGTSLQEALALRKEHEEMLNKLAAKEGEVMKMLSRADGLADESQPDADVHTEMTNALANAWRDLNELLKFRCLLLDESISFHKSAQEFSNKMDYAQKCFVDDCRNVPDIPTARRFLKQHQDMRKGILEASLQTLHDGQGLLDNIRQMGLSQEVSNKLASASACEGIEHLLETLQDRRRQLEDLWLQSKIRLEQMILMLLLDENVKKILSWFENTGWPYLTNTDLGHSLPSAKSLQDDHMAFQTQAREVQETVLHLLRDADNLVNNSVCDADAVKKRLDIVDQTSEDFTNELEKRRKNLASSVEFFKLADNTLKSLDDLEDQLKLSDKPISDETAMELLGFIDTIAKPVLKNGKNLIESVGPKDPGTKGVADMCALIEKRCASLRDLLLRKGPDAMNGWNGGISDVDANWKYNRLGEPIDDDFISKRRLIDDKKYKQNLSLIPQYDRQNEVPDITKRSHEDIYIQDKTRPILKPDSSPSLTRISRTSDGPEVKAPVAPRFLQDLQNQTVPEGACVTLDCVVVASPEPEVIWYHNGKPVKESVDFNLLFEGDKCSLIIKEAYQEDSGSYMCLARNKVGQAKSVCDLEVSAISDQLAVDVVRPEFTQLLQDVDSTEGEPVKFECRISGSPPPEVKWYKGDKQILNSADFQISSDLDHHWLTIPEVFKEDAGNYLVTAKNEGGEAKCYASLIIRPAVDKNVLKTRLVESAFTLPDYDLQLGCEPPKFTKQFSDTKVFLGQPCKLEVTVTGIPKPQVSWKLNNHPVTSPDHQVSTDGDQAHCLYISEMTPEHAGRYSVTAQNDYGKASCSALLVLAPEGQEPDGGWFSSEAPYADKGDQRSRKDLYLLNRLNATPSTYDKHIQAPSVGDYDSLKYTTPTFAEPLKDVQAAENAKATLCCTVTGYPKPRIKWFKSGREITDLNNMAVSYVNDVASLTINSALPEHAGGYTCRAENDAGHAETFAVLTVKASGADEVVSSSKVIPPQFKEILRDIESAEGELIKFDCQIIGFPVPDVKWYKGRQQILNSQDFQITRDRDRYTLTIPEVFKEDAGNYICRAKNCGGEAKCYATLTIKEDRNKNVVKMRLVESVNTLPQAHIPLGGEPPRFIKHFGDTKVRLGKPCKLEVIIAGNPKPKVYWKHEAKAMSPQDYDISTDGEFSHSLYIPEMTENDAGHYHLVAGNKYGEASCSAFLVVAADDDEVASDITSPPSEDVFITKPDELSRKDLELKAMLADKRTQTDDLTDGYSSLKYTAPKFVEHLRNTEADEKTTITLRCVVTGYPQPRITWYKSGKEITDFKTFVPSYVDEVATLTIRSIQPQHVGGFICKAENEAGSAESFAILSLRETTETREMRETEEVVSVRYYPPQLIETMKDVRIRLGEPAYFQCLISTTPGTIVEWYHNNKLLLPSDNIRISSDGYAHSLHIPSTNFDDTGVYKCFVRNPAGEVTCIAHLNTRDTNFASVMGKDLLSTQRAPHIYHSLSPAKDIPEGHTTRLTAGIISNPPPNYQWFMNGRAIEQSQRFKMEKDDFTVSLTILNSELDDSGEYMLKAVNPLGEANCQTVLNVKPTERLLEFPVEKTVTTTRTALYGYQTTLAFIVPLKPVVVAFENTTARLECQVAAYPYPNVTWYVNGLEIIPSSKYIPFLDGDLRVLEIRGVSREDEGEYSCRVRSDSGDSITTRTQLIVAEIEDKNKAPYFTEHLENKVTEDDLPVVLTCRVRGLPSPDVTWYYNGELLDVTNSNYNLTYDKDTGRIILKILNFTEENEGVFKCVAENSAGQDESVCSVLLSDEDPTGKRRKRGIGEDNVATKTELEQNETQVVTEKEKKIVRRIVKRTSAQPPQFKRPIHPCVVKEGDESTFRAVVQGVPEPTIMWFKDDTIPLQANDRYIINFEQETGTCTLTITNSDVSDVGIYSCQATNIAGRATCKANLVIVPSLANLMITENTLCVKKEKVTVIGDKETRVSESSPQFVTSLSPYTEVSEGDTVRLHVQFEAHPEAVVSWSHNSEPLVESSRLIVVTEDNETTVTIVGVSEQETGDYVCKVTNLLGSITTKTIVKIKPTTGGKPDSSPKVGI